MVLLTLPRCSMFRPVDVKERPRKPSRHAMINKVIEGPLPADGAASRARGPVSRQKREGGRSYDMT